uniref:Uncharacterized protein n=1 Tax=Mycena chlorophos TaxID=658473 RepID=A0ABQ0L7R7_MYCCL|nr:predicted protein [Mycena chlorophos]
MPAVLSKPTGSQSQRRVPRPPATPTPEPPLPDLDYEAPLGPDDPALERIPLPASRPKGLPHLYFAKDHPQTPEGGQAIVYWVDSSPEGQKKAWAYEKSLETPGGDRQSLLDGGLFELEHLYCVFARSIQGSGKPEDDVPMIWVVDGNLLPAYLFKFKRFTATRDVFIGDQEDRTLSRAAPTVVSPPGETPVRTELKGGVAFERSGFAKPVKGEGRSYTIGTSFETQTRMVAPAAAFKTATESGEKAARGKHEFVEAATDIAMTCMNMGPSSVRGYLVRAASLRNVPQYGVAGNYAFGTTQINVAAAQKPNAGKNSLGGDLGFFGNAHIDGQDSEGHFTHMMLDPDMPDDYAPGFFFLLAIGVFVVTKARVSVVFSGLRRHGGTPPLSPAGQAVVHWAVRIAAVTYPPTAQMNGFGRVRLGVWPNGDSLYLTPELVYAGIPYGNKNGYPPNGNTNRALFNREGIFLMPPDELIEFFVRALMLFTNYFFQQLATNLRAFYPDANYDFAFYPEHFERAFSYISATPDGNQQRRCVKRWDLAPGYRDSSVESPDPYITIPPDVHARMQDSGPARGAVMEEWDAYVARVHACTPSMSARWEHRPTSEAVEGKPKRKRGTKSRDLDPSKPPKPPRIRQPRKGKPKTKTAKAAAAAAAKGRGGRKGKGKKGEDDADGDWEDIDLNWNQPEDESVRPGSRPRLRSLPSRLGVDSTPPVPTIPAKRRADAKQPEEAGPKRLRADGTLWATDAFMDMTADADESSALDGAYWSRSPTRRPASMYQRRKHGEWAGEMVTEDPSSSSASRVAGAHGSDHFPFLDKLTLESIQSEAQLVEKAYQTLVHAPLGMADAEQRIVQTYNALDADPSSVAAAAGMATFWNDLPTLHATHDVNSVLLKLDRQSIMFSNYLAWNWLYDHCQGCIRRWIMGSATSTENWIERLASQVRRILRDVHVHATLASADFLPDLPPRTFVYSNRNHRKYGTQEALVAGVVYWSTAVIRAWFNFPNPDNKTPTSQFQAFFISVILSSIGRHALLLNSVWDAYRTIGKSVVGSTKSMVQGLARISTLHSQLRQHPLALTDSDERCALRTLGVTVDCIRLRACGVPVGMPEVPQPPEPTAVQSSSEPRPTLPNPHPFLPPAPSSPQLSDEQKGLLADFLAFIDEAVESVLHPNTIVHPTKWQQGLETHPDALLPFRHLAPSLKRTYEPDGPYDTQFANTMAGFYSGLVFRGVTFNTPFSRAGRLVYDGHGDFEAATSLFRQSYETENDQPAPSNLCCNTNAYGSSNHGRTIHLAQDYANSLHRPDLPRDLLAGGNSIDFLEFWTYLRSSKPEDGKWFPGLGPLASYLLAADYTYTSPRLVTVPTFKQMGYAVTSLNKGAASALETLRLIPRRELTAKGAPRKPNENDVQWGLKVVYDALQRHLSPEVQRAIGFDLIMVEHSLCKYSRAIGRNRWPNPHALDGRAADDESMDDESMDDES